MTAETDLEAIAARAQRLRLLAPTYDREWDGGGDATLRSGARGHRIARFGDELRDHDNARLFESTAADLATLLGMLNRALALIPIKDGMRHAALSGHRVQSIGDGWVCLNARCTTSGGEPRTYPYTPPEALRAQGETVES